MSYNKVFNELREVREELGLSRVALGGKLGVDATTIGDWENGVRLLNLSKLTDWAEALGCEILIQVKKK